MRYLSTYFGFSIRGFDRLAISRSVTEFPFTHYAFFAANPSESDFVTFVLFVVKFPIPSCPIGRPVHRDMLQYFSR
ncbi:MAG: hypothetical protein ABIP88_02095, partial [Candidatus Binatia bacterium]